MIKRETFQLLKKISHYYDQFTIDQEKVDLWHEVLKDYSIEVTQRILLAYVKNSAYPPKIADLIPHHPGTIPTVEETEDKMRITAPASESVVQKELANIRKILRIGRSGHQ